MTSSLWSGRPWILSEKQKQDVRDDLVAGMSVSAPRENLGPVDRLSCASVTSVHDPPV